MSLPRDHQYSKRDRPPKRKPTNPVEEAVKTWLSRLPTELRESIHLKMVQLQSCTPKRWVVYPPMVLLPPGSFGGEWWELLGFEVESGAMDELWKLLLNNISKREGKGALTHLAINSGIPLNKITSHSLVENSEEEVQTPESENILRTPSGLIMLFGDFGPSIPPENTPTEADLESAFWVSTKQNGITQVWAPRYTMFSRGNVKEKARILDFHNPHHQFASRNITREESSAASAVDLYAGIGYFVFSYAKMGMKQVIGWELNSWSVEGLRRGALANGWSVRVVKDGDGLQSFDEKIVVFLEDNAEALSRLHKMSLLGIRSIVHVNCGLLPTSEMTWETAIRILRGDGWLHLHENVGVDDIPTRRAEVGRLMEKSLADASDKRSVRMEHVERVKTFAPGVWHCVFDVFVSHSAN